MTAIYMGIFRGDVTSRRQKRYLTGVVAAAFVTAACFVATHPYAWRRIIGFCNPGADPEGSGWHVRQFALAAARGHWFGSKLGGAIWSNAYLPLPYNDSAFATLLETLGLVGAALLLALYCGLLASLVALSRRPKLRPEAELFILGAAVLTALQLLLHVGVNLGLLPTTGLTLPLVSYGGSSLLGCCMLFGMAISAARDCNGGNAAQRDARAERQNMQRSSSQSSKSGSANNNRCANS